MNIAVGSAARSSIVVCMGIIRRSYNRWRLERRGIEIKDLRQLSKGLRLEVEAPCFLNQARFSSSLGADCIRIGAYSYFRSDIRIGCLASMGRFCSIARGVIIGDTAHPTDWVSSHPFTYVTKYTGKAELMQDCGQVQKPPPIIGHDVWIGLNAVIMNGVTIGNGAIVGAGAVVTKDVPCYAIVGGVPAKVIRYRFPDALIERLQAIRWYDLNPAELVKFDCKDVERFVDQVDASRLRPVSYPVYRFDRRDIWNELTDL